jgi:hypothetical protein
VSNDTGFVRAIFVIEEPVAPKTGVLATRCRAVGIDRTACRGVPAVEMTAGLVLMLFQFTNAERDTTAVALTAISLSH